MTELVNLFGRSLVIDDRWMLDMSVGSLIDLRGIVEPVRLQPIAARILVIFTSSPHTVLSRKQLLDDGWRRFGFEVCENSLNQVIYALRNTFHELDPTLSYIRTVPRIGYCLLADVRLATPFEVRTGAGGAHMTTSRLPVIGVYDHPANFRRLDTDRNMEL